MKVVANERKFSAASNSFPKIFSAHSKVIKQINGSGRKNKFKRGKLGGKVEAFQEHEALLMATGVWLAARQFHPKRTSCEQHFTLSGLPPFARQTFRVAGGE